MRRIERGCASTRVIARRIAPKQPRGPDTVERATLLTLTTNNPAQSPGLLRYARNDAGGGGGGGALLLIIRVPREGGDLDPWTRAGSGSAVVGNLAERAVDEHPPLPTLSPSRGERASRGKPYPRDLPGV